MIAIDVKELSKVYKLYQSPVQRLKEIVLRQPFHTNFTALSNINFSVFTGETFGIIGDNGAGKSTLLKILAKTLQPTSGSVTIKGRTAALLELGAGFNPELTGEENIYLNAYLMGLSKSEIDRKKQEIIDFSELGDFINRPVKTYSSGMHVRLAFSIATSVDPDILIIDEALSVGDQHFQKKCIDRMTAFKNRNKTIIFCSHNLYQIQELCHRSCWLQGGNVRYTGKSAAVIDNYQNYSRAKTGKEPNGDKSKRSTILEITGVELLDAGGNKVDRIDTFSTLYLRFVIQAHKMPLRGHIGFALLRNDEEICFATGTHFDGYEPIDFKDNMEIKIFFPVLTLLSGVYFFRVMVGDDTALHIYDTAVSSSLTVQKSRKEFGIFSLEHKWKI